MIAKLNERDWLRWQAMKAKSPAEVAEARALAALPDWQRRAVLAARENIRAKRAAGR